MYKRDEADVPAPRRDLGPAEGLRLQGLHPDVQGGEVRRAAAGRLSFKAAGARYVVPVAEHHDGFPMYDCSFTDWSAAKMGPKRDVIGELADAVRAEGLVFGVSSHRAEHWWFYDQGMTFDSDVRDPRYRGSLRSRPGPEEGGGQTEPPDAALPRRLAGPHCGARRQVSPPARVVRLVDRPARLPAEPARRSPPSTTTAAPSGGRASPSTTRSTAESRSPTRPVSSTSSAASSRRSGRSSGRPIRRSRGAPGATSRSRTTSRSTPSSTTSSDIVEQERRAPPQHRAEARRHHSRGGGDDAAGDRGLARGQRRGDLRHAALHRLRRGPDAVVEGPLPTRSGRRSRPRTCASRPATASSMRSCSPGPRTAA